DIRALAAVGAPNFARENPPAALVDIVKHYKFHECLPREMIHEMARERFRCWDRAQEILEKKIGFFEVIA
ncbi:MAG: hypothetical protein GY859_18455, partial [Desulfobacterales bacterium]|nr:hypothetical protein [Desulfobacterales bacterium]